MAVKIGSNIESQKGIRQLGRATDALSSVNERLSSGQRINHASDDAAGLAIATSLNAKARIYTAAGRNVSDTISAVSIASDAVSALTEITTRQKELAEQAANGSYSNKQRQALDKESRELTNEYNRVVSTTQFNGIKLLDNPWDTLTTQLGIGSQASIGFKFADELSTKLNPGGYFLLGDGDGQSYVWFTIDGQGSDPAPLESGKGIEVDLISQSTPSATTVTVAPGSSFSQGGAGDGFYLGLPSSTDYFWFNVDGTNVDPGDPFGYGTAGHEVTILSGAAAGQVASVLAATVTSVLGSSVTVNLAGPTVTITDTSSDVVPFLAGGFGGGIAALSSISGTTASLSREGIASSVLTALNASGRFTASLGNSAGELIVQNSADGRVVGTQDVNSGIVITDTSIAGTGRDSYSVGGSPNDDPCVKDINGDNQADIVVVDNNRSTVSVFLNQGDGTFGARTSYAVGSNNVGSATVADINGDGKADIVTTDGNSGTISVLLNQGDGTFGPRRSYAFGVSGDAIVTDVNGDGKADIVTTNGVFNTVSVLLNQGNGTFGVRTSYAAGNNPNGSVTVTDINGDGRADIVTTQASPRFVNVLLNQGNGTFGASTSYAAGGSIGNSATVTDINGDGKADIVIANYGNAVNILLNQGNGTFGAQTSYAIGSSPNGSATVTDINGDGKADIVTADTGSDTVSVLINQGNGTFGARTSYAVGSFPGSSATVTDLNGDGKADIVTANSGSNTVSVLLNRGNGTFGTSISYIVGNNPNGSATVADVNGDGKADIITADTNSSTISVLLNQGNGTFGPSPGTPATQRLIFGDARGMTQINQIDLSTQFLSKKAMSVLDARLERLGKQQGVYGAVQSRLQTASRVLSTTTLNYRTAESRIMDTDIAQDAAEQTRLTIIQRAAASVLAQANLQPEIALTLLKS